MANVNQTTTNDAPKSRKLATPPSVELSEAQRTEETQDNEKRAKVLSALAILLPLVASGNEGDVNLGNDAAKLTHDAVKACFDRSKSLVSDLDARQARRDRSQYEAQAVTIAKNASQAQYDANMADLDALNHVPEASRKRIAESMNLPTHHTMPVEAFRSIFAAGTTDEAITQKLCAIGDVFSVPTGRSAKGEARKVRVKLAICAPPVAK